MTNTIRNGLSNFHNMSNSKDIKVLDNVILDTRIENENNKPTRFFRGVEKTLLDLKHPENYSSQKNTNINVTH